MGFQMPDADCLHLENGFDVYFVDRSSPPVAGRCRVELLIRVPIEPAEEYFNSYPDPAGAHQHFLALAGSDPVEFQTIKIRNFIDQAQVNKVLARMKEDFMRFGLQYLKKPGFAAGFIRKKYEELLTGEMVRIGYENVRRGK